MTLAELESLARAMVSGREQIPNITSSSTITKLKRDAELGDSVLALIAVVKAAKAMHVEYDHDLYTTATNKAFKDALAELERE